MGSNSIPIWHPSLTAIVIAQLSFAPLTEYKKMRECGGLGLTGRAGQTGTGGRRSSLHSRLSHAAPVRRPGRRNRGHGSSADIGWNGAMDSGLRDSESFER